MLVSGIKHEIPARVICKQIKKIGESLQLLNGHENYLRTSFVATVMVSWLFVEAARFLCIWPPIMLYSG